MKNYKILQILQNKAMLKKLGVILYVIVIISFFVFTLFKIESVVALTKIPLETYAWQCDENSGIVAPYRDIIFSKLNLVDNSVLNSNFDEVNKEILYENVFIRKMGLSPYNAINYNGKLYFQTCNTPDFNVAVSSQLTTGKFIVGYLGSVSREMQPIIDDLYIQNFRSAEVKISNNKYKLDNLQICSECTNLFTKSNRNLSSKMYKITFEKIDFEPVINQGEELKVKVTLKNDDTQTVPSLEYFPIYLKISSAQTVYHSSWISPDRIVAINSENIPVGGSKEIEFILSPSLVPKKYKIDLSTTNSTNSAKLEFEVKSKGLKLGRIESSKYDLANVRKVKSFDAEAEFRLAIGDIVIIRKDEGAWLEIETRDGRKGWVYVKFIKKL